MENQKLEILRKMEEKGMSPARVAEAIEFNPNLLGLYLVNDDYPVPKRILDKIEGVLQ